MRGIRVAIFDIDGDAVAGIMRGEAPFLEPGIQEPLAAALERGLLSAGTDRALVSASECVVVVVGTPVDEHLSPDPQAVPRALEELCATPPRRPAGRAAQHGLPRRHATVERLLERTGLDVDVAFCPERIAEGQAMTELFALPQIVAARTPARGTRAGELFGHAHRHRSSSSSPEEAELAKLFTNTWRYIKFAAANQFYVMANDHGLDFDAIREAMAYDYPRAADLPGAGFAAGPCLFKDTMQLAAFTDNTFVLGHSAMLVNEGLPLLPGHADRGRSTSRADCRHPRDGVQGRAATTSARACPTS